MLLITVIIDAKCGSVYVIVRKKVKIHSSFAFFGMHICDFDLPTTHFVYFTRKIQQLEGARMHLFKHLN